jgi:trimeric autotransporter adhesin
MNIFRSTTPIATDSMNRSPWWRAFLLTPLVVGCFALLPSAQAVTPAPDGGYPGHNTAEGTDALFSRTTGVWDTAIGAQALYHDTTGTANTGLGYNALFNNIGGNGNTANGTFTLFSNTSGASNTALGNSALYKNTTGNSNTAMGASALHENTSGSFNIAVGQAALANNTADGNTAVGFQALLSNIAGTENTAIGVQALFSNTDELGLSGDGNTAIGAYALSSNVTQCCNTAIGARALANSVGPVNTAIGAFALGSNTSGGGNTATGINALTSNTTGAHNTAIGANALANNTGVNGSSNTALGFLAGESLTTGNNNIDIGSNVLGVAGESNTTRIGIGQTRTFIAGIRGRTTANANAVPVLIDSAGQLGTASSSRRFKNDIKSMDKVSEAILALKPVTFHYKSDDTGTPQFGLIAEEVAAVNPDLVVRDENGEIYTVRYDAVNAMLLNEFLKEHRKVQEQTATILQLKHELESRLARQQNQIEALKSALQKVSAEIEIRHAAPQIVENNQ